MASCMSWYRLFYEISSGTSLWIAMWGHADVAIRTNVFWAVYWALVTRVPRDIKN